ncbi:MAG: chemotaxis signal relay system methyltransferase CheR [Roseibaca calidilacus]|uniref:protein-glutamate O-methyltransferase n=1 Tax=Roseibaca calidilacus TaxID=1666912 RepID=A0A0P7WNC4_9RHOB|nr:protein-glutamate O-methyltransferase CheR [Roseibaca calidilacus]KPP95533.1 MAG: chemotaxis signal relay system methyltransferase CheR [Roseibaca calidilacus]CUX82133.1 MCP methyltransferase, CheR-type [Roseibaca calidilacus]
MTRSNCPPDEVSLEAISSWLERSCAIHYPESKRDLLLQRLGRVQHSLGFDSLCELAQALLRANTEAVQLAIVHAASTNHTYFFREMDTLSGFQQNVLPDLAKRPEIRLWSAACSTGDEVYTLAILIAETLGLEALKRTHILGTDISGPVIETAEAGRFSKRHLEQVPEDILRRYLRPVGQDQFEVIPELRAACTFRRMNLKKAPYPFKYPFQAVFCRNVLYYFAPADQLEIVNAIADVTERNGWLYTSVTESMRGMSPRWRALTNGTAQCVDGVA